MGSRVLLFAPLMLAGCPPWIGGDLHDCNVGDPACEDDTEDTNDFHEFDQLPDGEGLTGMWGQITRRDYIGGYWDGGAFQGFGFFGVIEPQDIAFSDGFAPGNDRCASDYPGTVVEPIDLGIGNVAVEGSNDSTYDFSWDGTWFVSTEIDEAAFQSGLFNLLDTDDGNFGSFAVDSLTVTPSPFIWVEPDLDVDVPPMVARNRLHFTWVGAAGSLMTLEITHLDATQQVQKEVVTCLMQNDGEFSVPDGVWQDEWEQGDVFITTLSAIRTGVGVLELNNSVSQVRGRTAETGAFFAPHPDDLDADGFWGDDDCAPLAGHIYPAAPELCDGFVNDCEITTGLPANEVDNDSDGYVECLLDVDPADWGSGQSIVGGGDCNDGNGSRHPGAPEICNGADDDCDNVDDNDCENP